MSYPHIGTADDYRRYCEAFRRGCEGFESLTGYRPYLYRLRVSWIELDFRQLCPVTQVSEEIEATAHGRAQALQYAGNHASWEAIEGPHCVRVEVEICSDCVHFAEYGQLDDLTMLVIEESEVAPCAA